MIIRMYMTQAEQRLPYNSLTARNYNVPYCGKTNFKTANTFGFCLTDLLFRRLGPRKY